GKCRSSRLPDARQVPFADSTRAPVSSANKSGNMPTGQSRTEDVPAREHKVARISWIVEGRDASGWFSQRLILCASDGQPQNSRQLAHGQLADTAEKHIRRQQDELHPAAHHV